MAENTIIHEISLAGYKATSTGGMLDLGTWGSYGIEKLHLTLDAAWQDLTITAFFNVKGKVVAKKVVRKDGYADVPWEATKESTFAGRIVFEGSINGQRRITTDLNYKVTNHSEITDIDPVPTDDRWNQFVTETKEYRDGAFEAAKRANARAEDAEAASEDAQAAARAAKVSENAAKASADKAGPYAKAAQTAKEAAENAAAAAAASKSAADTLATEAARAAKAAEDSKAAANNAVNLAGENATAAQQAAGTATAAANDAGQSASDAAASKAAAETAAKAALDAQTAAAAAKAEAVKAQGAAETAAKSAQDAQAAAEKARDDAKTAQKGAEAARDTAAKSAEAAAKSEANAKQSADTLAESVENVVANTAAVAELKQQVKNITPDDSSIGEKPWSSKHIIDMLCPPLEESGNPVVCYPVAGYPLSVKAKWEPMQEGSGTPSPENIRPIKGRDNMTVERCGENLSTTAGLDGVGWAAIYEDLLNVLNKLPAGTYVLDFTFTLKNFFDRYTSDTAESNAFRINSRFDDGTPCIVTEGETITKSEKLPSVRKITETFVITPQHKGRVATAYFYACGRGDAIEGAPNGALGEGDISNVTITLGTTAPTTYTPYNGQTNTLTLPETIYGGEVDAVSGEGRKVWKSVALDGTENWIQWSNTAFHAYYIVVSDILDEMVLCDRYAYSNSGGPQAAGQNTIIVQKRPSGVSYVCIRAAEKEQSVSEWKAYLAAQNDAGTPVQIAYKLATPTPFTATGAQPLPALAGVNTVLTDAASAAVTGRADPTKRTTDLEAAVASIN